MMIFLKFKRLLRVSFYAGNLEEVQRSIDDGIDVNSVDLDGNTLLHIAVKHSNQNSLHIILSP